MSKSLTNQDSLIVKISNIQKKMDKKIISVINQKGGVGKTTTVIKLSSKVINENEILVIDLDSRKCNNWTWFVKHRKFGANYIFSPQWKQKISEMVKKTKFEI